MISPYLVIGGICEVALCPAESSRRDKEGMRRVLYFECETAGWVFISFMLLTYYDFLFSLAAWLFSSWTIHSFTQDVKQDFLYLQSSYKQVI